METHCTWQENFKINMTDNVIHALLVLSHWFKGNKLMRKVWHLYIIMIHLNTQFQRLGERISTTEIMADAKVIDLLFNHISACIITRRKCQSLTYA